MTTKLKLLTKVTVKLNEEVALNYPFWIERDRIPEFKDMPEAGDYIPLSRIKIEKIDLRETGVDYDYIISFFSAKINKWVRIHNITFGGGDLGYSVMYSSPLLKVARIKADAIIQTTNNQALRYTKSLTEKDKIKL